MLKGDLVSVVEAAYELEADDQVWMEKLVRVVASPLDQGAGVLGVLLDATRAVPETATVMATATRELADGAYACFGELQSRQPTQDLQRRFIEAGPVGTLRGTLGETFDDQSGYGETLKKHGFGDALYVLAGDPLGINCVLVAPARAAVRVRPRIGIAWTRAAAHIASAYRLRRHLRGAMPAGGRAALRSAAAASEGAPGPLRRATADDAAALWDALIAGRWSLVDRFDGDGRRWLLARKNETAPPPMGPLSKRERQVVGLAAVGHSNKLISYELGLAPSTVATHLASAMRKLSVETRIELVQLLSTDPPSSRQPAPGPRRAR